MFYVYRFLDKNDEVILVSLTKSLERQLRHKNIKEDIASQVKKIEYIQLEEEFDAELAVRYYSTIFKAKIENEKMKKFKDLTFKISALDKRKWREYKNINNLKWRKELINECYQLKCHGESLLDVAFDLQKFDLQGDNHGKYTTFYHPTRKRKVRMKIEDLHLVVSELFLKYEELEATMNDKLKRLR